MKKTILLSLSLLPSFCFATITFSGTAIQDAPLLDIGERYVYLSDDSGSSFDMIDSLSIIEGSLIDSSTTYEGFTVFGSGTVSSFFGTAFIGTQTNGLVVDLGSDIVQGDSFGILVYNSSSDAAIVNDTFDFYTDETWKFPADGSTETFGSHSLVQLDSGSSPIFSGVVSAIPEPSFYAVFLGFFALGYGVVGKRCYRSKFFK